MEKLGRGPEAEKPQVLYHASPNKGIENVNPSRIGYRDPDEGHVVFATPDKVYASMFLVKTNDSWTRKGRFSEAGVKGPWHMIISDKERFLKEDQGGSIYSFDPKDFSFDPEKNMGSNEWTSNDTVQPTGEEIYESGLDEMKKAGVEVYFVDSETWKAISESDDHGHAILKGLSPEK